MTHIGDVVGWKHKDSNGDTLQGMFTAGGLLLKFPAGVAGVNYAAPRAWTVEEITAWGSRTIPAECILPLQSDQDAWTAEYELAQTWAGGDLATAKALRVAETKEEAGKRILLATGPTYAQMNNMARSMELVNAKANGTALTASEASELAGIEGLWGRVKALRADSTVLENAIQGLSTYDAVKAIDTADNIHWSE